MSETEIVETGNHVNYWTMTRNDKRADPALDQERVLLEVALPADCKALPVGPACLKGPMHKDGAAKHIIDVYKHEAEYQIANEVRSPEQAAAFEQCKAELQKRLGRATLARLESAPPEDLPWTESPEVYAISQWCKENPDHAELKKARKFVENSWAESDVAIYEAQYAFDLGRLRPLLSARIVKTLGRPEDLPAQIREREGSAVADVVRANNQDLMAGLQPVLQALADGQKQMAAALQALASKGK